MKDKIIPISITFLVVFSSLFIMVNKTDTAKADTKEVLSIVDLPVNYSCGIETNGNMFYISDINTSKIYLIDSAGNIHDSFSTLAEHPWGLALGDSCIWQSSCVDNMIYKIDINTKEIVDSFNGPGSHPHGLTYDGEFLWIADYDTGLIYKIDPDTGSEIDSISLSINYLQGLAWDGKNLWVVESGTVIDTIHKIDPDRKKIMTSITSPDTVTAGIVCTSPLHMVLIGYRSNDMYTMRIFVDVLSCPANQPAGLTKIGYFLWNIDKETNIFYKICPENGKIHNSFNPNLGYNPTGLTCDGQYIWSADLKQDMIYQIAIYSGEKINEFSSPNELPYGLAWDGEYLWNADSYDNEIYKLNPITGAKEKTISTPGDSPWGLTFDGEFLYNVDSKEKKIYKINPETGQTLGFMSLVIDEPKGLTYYDDKFWIVDDKTDFLYELELDFQTNFPPNTPNKPSGPTEINPDVYKDYTTSGTDSNGDKLLFMFDWDDGSEKDWVGPYDSGEELTAMHKWEEPGEYRVRVKSKDIYGSESPYSKTLLVNVDQINYPYKPSTPDGPNPLNPKAEGKYSSVAIDPEGDDLYYNFDWGDGTTSGWLGPIKSGERRYARHTWDKRDQYEVKVQVKDENGFLSEVSDPLILRIEIAKSKNNIILPRIIEEILIRFPIFNSIISKIF